MKLPGQMVYFKSWSCSHFGECPTCRETIIAQKIQQQMRRACSVTAHKRGHNLVHDAVAPQVLREQHMEINYMEAIHCSFNL